MTIRFHNLLKTSINTLLLLLSIIDILSEIFLAVKIKFLVANVRTCLRLSAFFTKCFQLDVAVDLFFLFLYTI